MGVLATKDIVVTVGTKGDGDTFAKKDEGKAVAILSARYTDRTQRGPPTDIPFPCIP